MENPFTKDKLFRNMVILNIIVFFWPWFKWLLTAHFSENIISSVGIMGLPIIAIFSSAKLSRKQFWSYWSLTVLTLYLAVFLGCVTVSLITGYEIEMLTFLLQAAIVGLVTFIFWGLMSFFLRLT